MSEEIKELLDLHYSWPAPYHFKFVVKALEVSRLRGLLSDGEFRERPSRQGKYMSVTFTKTVHSSVEVLEVYEKVKIIEGIYSL